MTDDLVAFLRARLEERYAAAEAAGGDTWDVSSDGIWHEDLSRNPGAFAVGSYGYLGEEGAHIALHDPARTLRKIEADRRIIDLAEEAWAKDDTNDGGYPSGYADALEDALASMAAEYDDHPGYRAEWRP